MQQKALIDLAIQHALRNSLRGLAEQISVSSGVLSEWRTDAKPMPDERIAQLCAIAKVDGPEWMARIHAARAQSPTEKALWRQALERLSAAAAVVALILPLAGGVKAENLVNSMGYQTATTHSLYIMFRRWLARFVHRTRPRTGWSLTHA